MLTMTNSPPTLLLHPADNILIAAVSLRSGDIVEIDGSPIEIKESVGVGHKIARAGMPQATKILRYGAPIGSLTAAVRVGEHIHSHNLKSDYIASHGRHATKLEE